MDDFVTIASFNMPYQVHIIQGRLQSEGIRCRLKDEYIAYTQYYSNAAMGIKLQVTRGDYERAKQILIENGYQFNHEETIPKWYIFLSEKTLKIPFMNRFSLGKRILILSILLVVVAALVYFFTGDSIVTE
jgi:hypothetical protein